MSRIVVPVRYSAWLVGSMGDDLTALLRRHLRDLDAANVTRARQAFLVESRECDGPAVEAVARAVRALEADVKAQYPVFYTEMGPVWTGTLQVILHDYEVKVA